MFNQYTYKQKLIFLLVFTVFLSIAAYRRSFSHLFTLLNQNQILTEEITTSEYMAANLQQIQNEHALLLQKLGTHTTDLSTIQQSLVTFISSRNSTVKINHFNSVHRHIESGIGIITFEIDLIGNYSSLATLTYDLERDFEYAKIVHLNYYTIKKGIEKPQLHLKILLQKYENL